MSTKIKFNITSYEIRKKKKKKEKKSWPVIESEVSQYSLVNIIKNHFYSFNSLKKLNAVIKSTS